MTDTQPDAPPDGWVVCDEYPQPGDVILLWQPATSSSETSDWVPARVKDRRLRGGTSRTVRPMLGYGRPVAVRRLPVHYYATVGDPVTQIDLTSPRPTSGNPSDPCVCGHSLRNHGQEDGRGVCFVCTSKTGGCQGFTPSRPETTAAEHDAFVAGFHRGELWAITTECDAEPSRYVPERTDEQAESAYVLWVEGGESA